MNIQNTDIRQHILDTAKPIILGKGFSAVGLNELLNAAEVPKGSFYHYFKSKEYFGEALLDSYFEAYLMRLEILLSAEGMNGAERLMSYWQRWLETQCGDDAETKCMVVKLGGEVSDLSEPMRLALQRGTNHIISRLADGIEEGIADGSLPNDLVAADTALVLYNQWLGATVLTKIWHDQSALESSMCNTERILKHARPSDT
ncbi:MAG: TetR/AcrR family transcriptional regulator [Planktomarina sp.]|jgi:TetR/AcrR family transcriptional repressor of nem operon|nr:TetR/AcrR family transcriptional regulator [Planktomarina sp.]